MEIYSRFRLPLIAQCLLFLVPVNIYVLGDWLAAGVQWILFRYQQSYLGNSLLLFTRDLYYLQEGIIKGRSALASEIAVVAAFCMICAVFLLFYAYAIESGAWVKTAAMVSLGGGCLYLIGDMVQYGMFFQGPSGFTIPVGVPAILVCGLWMYRMKFPDNDTERLDEPQCFDDENP